MKRHFLFYLFFTMLNASYVNATCSGTCYDLYCGPNGNHGYCTDYIQHRLGVRQSGDGGNWEGNLDSNDVEVGDVAIFDFGSYGHVAIVDSVNDDSITISEWNWGGCNTERCNPACAVTDNYGIETSRVITKNSVTRFWRPGATTQRTLYRTVTDRNAYGKDIYLFWTPHNVSCINAQKWCHNGRCSKDYTAAICYDVYSELRMINQLKYILPDWQDTFFGADYLDDGNAQCEP